ncbi:MAG: lytic transglycosylase domain-containing protein [Gammaproteobacteria bacterium]|nr:lytic transglycosylase domain-containing protein [Gammaproteobacteria bacterium]
MHRRLATLLLASALLVTTARAAVIEQRDDPQLRTALLTAIQDNNSFEDRFEAEVWLMDMSNRLRKRMPDAQERIELLKMIHFEAARVDVPPELVLAVIEVESNFDRWAVSSAGAQGFMQVMPFWLAELGRPDDSLQQPHINLRLGCTILRYYLDRERGDLRRALARYNGSPLIHMNSYPQRVLDALRIRWYRQ